jgi:alanine dehydrogenase
MADFFNDPTDYSSDFMKYARQAQMYIACHFWDSRAPFIYTRDDMKHPNWNIDLVADISCDIDGPVASTIRPSTIADPLYGYDPGTESETDFMNPDAIGVMAVDNLPCELPRDASEDFGSNLIQHVLPALLGNDSDGLIERSTLCENGALTPNFAYLENYVQGSA